MEAIVLAGGFGTRLRQVVPDLPKPMAPVLGRPFLEILLSSLASKGFHRVVLSLGFLAEKVIAHFGDGFAGMELIYEVENTPLGTGGAVRRSLSRCMTDHAFIFNGDTYLDLEVAIVEKQWQQRRQPIIIAREVADTARYGRLDVEGGRLMRFSEKGMSTPGLINAGCYVFPVSLLDSFPDGQAFSLEAEFLDRSMTTSSFDVFVTQGKFIDIGVPEDYERAQSELVGFFG